MLNFGHLKVLKQLTCSGTGELTNKETTYQKLCTNLHSVAHKCDTNITGKIHHLFIFVR